MLQAHCLLWARQFPLPSTRTDQLQNRWLIHTDLQNSSRNSDWLPVVEVPNVRNLDVPGPNGLRVAVNPAQVRVAASSCAG